MPKGTASATPRHTEVVARESITQTFLDAQPLLNSTDPASWGLAAQRFDEMADMARQTEAEFIRRRLEARAAIAEDQLRRMGGGFLIVFGGGR